MLFLESIPYMAEIKLILYHTCQTRTETLDFQAHASTKVPQTLAKTETQHLFSQKYALSLDMLHELLILSYRLPHPPGLDDCFIMPLFCNAEESFLLVYFPNSDSLPLC